MQLSGRGKGSSSAVHRLQQLNGIVKQPMSRHRNNAESEPTQSNSKSTDEGPSIANFEHTSHAVNEKLRASSPPSSEMDSSSLKTNSESSADHSDNRMEISENGASEINEHDSENFDSTLAMQQNRGETERSNGVVGVTLCVNGERVKDEEGREGECEGQGEGEIMASEEHMEVITEEENDEEQQGYPQAGGYHQSPGFGKHQRGSVMHTDLGSRQHKSLLLTSYYTHTCTEGMYMTCTWTPNCKGVNKSFIILINNIVLYIHVCVQICKLSLLLTYLDSLSPLPPSLPLSPFFSFSFSLSLSLSLSLFLSPRPDILE